MVYKRILKFCNLTDPANHGEEPFTAKLSQRNFSGSTKFRQYEAAAQRWDAELHWIRGDLQPCHPFWQKMFVCGHVRKLFGPSHVLQLDSVLQNPDWARNQVMQSFVYHFIGASKPHLENCRWQRFDPPEIPFAGNARSRKLIAKWGSNPPATFDIGRVFRPELAANLLAVYPNLIVTGSWSNDPEVRRRRLEHYDETFASHLVLTRFLLRLGVNARRFQLRIKDDVSAT